MPERDVAAFTVRLPREEYEQLKALAEREFRPIGLELRLAVVAHLNGTKKKAAA